MAGYEWRIEKSGNRRFVRFTDEPVNSRLEYVKAEPVAEIADEAPVPAVAPTKKPAPTKKASK